MSTYINIQIISYSYLFTLDSKLLHKEALSIQKLSDARLSARNVAVHLDPGAPDWHKLARLDKLTDVCPHTGVHGLDPLILLGLEIRGRGDFFF